MNPPLTYDNFERLHVPRPVDRLAFIAERCCDKVVLDLGCLDETALIKRDSAHWLHGRIAQVARQVVGVDASDQLPPKGLITGPNARIHRGDATNINPVFLDGMAIDMVVAGEFIEHLDNPLHFLTTLREVLPGRELILSTPNGLCFGNTLMGMIRREVQHRDHLANFTFKTLNTLCERAGLQEWEIRPYQFYATEMILRTSGLQRTLAMSVQALIRVVERLFPLLSFGYIVVARL